MSATTVTVAAPSQRTMDGMLVSIKTAPARAWQGLSNNGRKFAQKTRLDKGYGFIRKAFSKVASIAMTIARAAGIVPLGLLTVSSRSGQAVIRAVARTTWNIWSWASNKVLSIIDFTMRLFGKPGRRLADKTMQWRTMGIAWIEGVAIGIGQFVAPYFSPDMLYMKAIKVVSYMMVATGLVTTFLPGVWMIPGFLIAAIVGLVSSKTVRESVFVGKIVNVFEDDAKVQARVAINKFMDELTTQYGPDMEKWTSAAKGEFIVKQAIRKAIDGDPHPFTGLTGNQKRRAEKWLRDYEASLLDLASDLAKGELAGDTLVVDPDSGRVTVEHAPPPAA